MSAPEPKVRVFLVDDHAVVRQGTRELLCQDPQLSVVGEADSGQGLESLLAEALPDVLLLDINLPGQNGLQLLEALKSRFPDLKILLFSAHAEVGYLRKAMQLQADGFLSKLISGEELRALIRQAVSQAGRPVFSADIARMMAAQAQTLSEIRLTAREHEILVPLAQGLTNQGIARLLCLSVKTVDTHVANLIKKTGVSNRTQLVAFAYERHLI